jgi:hypothetical protein
MFLDSEMHGLDLFDPNNYSTLIRNDSLQKYSSRRFSIKTFLKRI